MRSVQSFENDPKMQKWNAKHPGVVVDSLANWACFPQRSVIEKRTSSASSSSSPSRSLSPSPSSSLSSSSSSSYPNDAQAMDLAHVVQ